MPRGLGRPRGGSDAPAAREAMHYLSIVLGVSVVMATVFTAWSPASLRPGQLAENLMALVQGGEQPVTTPAPDFSPGQGVRVGIVAGHSGINPISGVTDPGSQCPDGLAEVDVNLSIARQVADRLEAAGFAVDLLEEFDQRLVQYRAAALVSIHADTCAWINEFATGYKVSGALDTAIPDRTQRLVDCIADRYGRATGLRFQYGSITRDMTDYHTFREVHSQTPAVIIETGFLNLDRDFLTQNPDKAAIGIVDGLLCYLYNEPATVPIQGAP
jgi:N-acetylmuramoyl-L-alanine amidase